MLPVFPFRPGTSLRARILATTTTLVVGLMLASLVITHTILGRLAAQEARTQMERSTEVVESFFSMRRYYLAREVALAGEMQTLKTLLAYIRATGGQVDRDPSLRNTVLAKARDFQSLLEAERRRLPGELAVLVFDAQGRLLARTDRQDAPAGSAEPGPDVVAALEGEVWRGEIIEEGEVYQAATAPLSYEDDLVGLISARYRLDVSVATHLSQQTGSAIGFVAAGRLTAATDPRVAEAWEMLQRSGVSPGSGSGARVVEEPHYLAAALYLGWQSQADAYCVVVHSLDRALAPARKARNAYLVAGLAALLLVSVAAFAVARGITRPLGWVTEAARSLEAGQWPEALPAKGHDEAAVLADAFNRMVQSLQESQARLEQSQRVLIHNERLASMGQLAAGIAHEVNNPLAAISGYAQLLLMQRGRLDADAVENLERILLSTQRITRIMRGLLDFARQKGGGPGEDAPLQPCDVNEIVRQALVLTEHTLNRFRDVEVVTELGEGLPPVMADNTEIEQVLINLLINAADAMPEGGSVRLRTTAGDGAVEIAVADTGTGVPPEVLPHLFEPFYTTKGPGEGTGLGLAICHGIVERHRGQITVESEPGKGATFRVRLPAAGAPNEGIGPRMNADERE